MRDAVICEPLRTPVGRYGGVFRDVPAADLAAAVIRELVARTGVTPEDIDDVLLG
jgi:acetyl-CoA C-acetyltransferase